MNTAKTPIPQGMYQPATRYAHLVYSAGMTPRLDGVLLMAEQVTSDQPLEYYQTAVRQAAANALTAVRSTLGADESIKAVMSTTVYVNAVQGFAAHSKIADMATQYLFEELGSVGVSSRAAIGVASLPGNAPVEIQIVCFVG